MDHADQLSTIRQTVLRTFEELGAEKTDLTQVTDTLLIRDGHYCGRSFRAGGMMAMWMGGIVQFYGPHGQLLRTLQVTRTVPHHQARAA